MFTMEEQIPYLKPSELEQCLISKIQNFYHKKNSSSISHCEINKLNYNSNESDIHLKRKIILSFVFKYFISEASRTNVAFDFRNPFPYRNGNGMDIIRDMVDIVPGGGTIHEIETGIGMDEGKKRKERFLYQLPWIKGNKFPPNTKNIRDPDYQKIIVHSFENDNWEVFRIKRTNSLKSKDAKFFTEHVLEFSKIKKYCSLSVDEFENIAIEKIKNLNFKPKDLRIAKLINILTKRKI